MMDPPPTGGKQTLKAAAVSGSIWSGMQMAVNKVTSLASTLLTMYLLLPSDFGIAAVSGSILSYVCILPAFTLSDVLLSRPTSVNAVMPAARRLCALTTAASVVVLLAVGYACAGVYGDDRIFYACCMLIIRPIGEFLLLEPQTLLRARLEFRRISQIDAVTQCGASVASVTMAALGAGYASLVLPQAIAVLVRASFYSRLTRQEIVVPQGDAGIPHPWRRLLKDYGLSGLGQYVHGGLIVAPPLILAAFCTKEIVGYFSTAFALSASFNSVVAVGLGLVLQPVFAHMGDDLARQRRAFVRACSVIAAASMPVCMCQALCVAPAFRLAMPPSWQGAIAFAQMLSLGQSLYFVVNPAMGLLKAQGRFTTFFVWQSVQLVVVIGGMVACGTYVNQPAAWIVAVYSFYHLVFSPMGLTLCIPPKDGLWTAMREVFLSPLAASLLTLAPVALGSLLLPEHWASDALLLAVAPVSVFAIYPRLLRLLAPETYADCKDAIGGVLRTRSKAA